MYGRFYHTCVTNSLLYLTHRIGVMFKYLGRQALGETLFRSVEVADNRVATPPLNRQMVSGSTRAMSRATTPPARRECALMSASVKPIYRPSDRTTALMEAVMLSPQICCHLLTLLKLVIDVSPVAPWCCRYATRRRMAATGHSWGWPVRPCPIDYPLKLFLWFVNRRLIQSV